MPNLTKNKYQSVNADFHNNYRLEDYLHAYYSERQFVYQGINALFEARKVLELSTGKKNILLIGVGFGRELDLILKASQANVTIIDLNSNFLNKIESVYNKDRVKSIKLNLDEADCLPLAENTFDLVVALNTIEYVITEEQTMILLSEISRVMENNGLFFTRFLNGSSLQGKLINKLMGNRGSNQSRYIAKNYEFFMNSVKKFFHVKEISTLDFSLNFGPGRYLYSNTFGYPSYVIGKFLGHFVPGGKMPFYYLLLESR